MNDDFSSRDTRMPEAPVRDIDATIGFESNLDTSLPGEPVSGTKQYRDLAFATALLASGMLKERQLVLAIENWTIHGEQLLADHLVAADQLSLAEREQVETRSESEFRRTVDWMSRHPDLRGPERDRVWLSRLDRSGKLGKVLGIGDDSMLAADDHPLRTVGARYTLLRKLGQGGLGTVWLARDENLRRYVAVKEVSQNVGSDDLILAHFRREAEITGRLEHPAIVPVYQFGMDESTGRGFYVMRFLGKRTLQDALVEYHERRTSGNEEPMMQHHLLTAFVTICQAVAHAHSRNVIHRDLKPENIALDRFGQVVLLDWGLAKIDDETGMYDAGGLPEPGDLHNVGATVAGRVLGTPLYMAPEQAAGRLDEVDELTDVFGLGGILFAILTGVAPHEAALESADGSRSATDVFSTILSEAVQPPCELVPDVPRELDAICRRALAPKRYLRYNTASELAADVQRYMAGASVTAYEAPVALRVRRWMSAHPTSTQLMLLLSSLVLLGGAAIAYTARQGATALQEARYVSLTEITRELEANLRFEAQGLVQNVRFVTELPLMQAVTTSLDTANEVENASAEEWLDRQGGLLDGMLRANPAYLVMATCELEGTSVVELVRSERFAHSMHAHRVPKSRLVVGELDQGGEGLSVLRPGEVVLLTGDQLSDHVPTRNRSPLVLVAVSPIFEERTGELFGINLIELDLRKRLEDLLLVVAPEDVTVYVTDAKGGIVLSCRDGDVTYVDGKQSIANRFRSLSGMFQQAGNRRFGDGSQLHATLVQVGSDSSQAVIGIVAELHEP